MLRRDFLNACAAAGLLPILDCVGVLDEREVRLRALPDSAVTVQESAHQGGIPPSANSTDGAVMTRLKQELSIIRQLGLEEEFQAANVVFRLAQDERIPCRLVGAGCSSTVNFLIGASNVLPTGHGLFFERFRDPNGRWAPPFLIYVDEAMKNRLVDFAKSRYPRLVADGTLSFLPMPPSMAILWKVAGFLRKAGIVDFDLGQIPSYDPEALALLRSGDTEGIVPFHDRATRTEMQSLQPSSLADLVVISALYRLSVDQGGLMRIYRQRVMGSQDPKALHPVIVEATADSRGLILFQEQVMIILSRLGGITVADGYDFVKAAAIRKSAVVAQYRASFLAGASKNGLARKTAEAVFEQLRLAASYVCCKAGCVADAVIIYHGAYLKAHYPAEFSQAVWAAVA